MILRRNLTFKLEDYFLPIHVQSLKKKTTHTHTMGHDLVEFEVLSAVQNWPTSSSSPDEPIEEG